MDKVYAAMYSDCIFESGLSPLSLHRTEQGARNALAKFLREEREDHNRINDYDPDQMVIRFGEHSGWRVAEIEVYE